MSKSTRTQGLNRPKGHPQKLKQVRPESATPKQCGMWQLYFRKPLTRSSPFAYLQLFRGHNRRCHFDKFEDQEGRKQVHSSPKTKAVANNNFKPFPRSDKSVAAHSSIPHSRPKTRSTNKKNMQAKSTVGADSNSNPKTKTVSSPIPSKANLIPQQPSSRSKHSDCSL